MRRDAFQAIADPTRRSILALLAAQTLTLNAIAQHYEVSRPAISKHVRILNECGLLTIRDAGRERYCEARLEKLHEVSKWVEQYKAFWESKLNSLELYLNKLQKSKRHAKSKK